MNILQEANDIIHGDREQTYGDPGINLRRIANLWNAYLLNRPLDEDPSLGPRDVALMMALLKVAREQHQHKDDNLVDACGYLALINMLGDQ